MAKKKDYFNPLKVFSDLANLFSGGGGGGQPAAPAAAAPAPVAPATPALPAPFLDPLSMQMFFTQTLQPFMDHIAKQESSTADELGNVEGQVMKGSMPAYAKQILGATIPQEQADMKEMASTQEAAAVAQPTLANMMAQLKAVSNLYTYYYPLLQQQQSGSAGLAGLLGGAAGLNPAALTQNPASAAGAAVAPAQLQQINALLGGQLPGLGG